MDFERMNEVIAAVGARRGADAAKALDLHAKVMAGLAVLHIHFQEVGDQQRSNIVKAMTDNFCLMSGMAGVTPEDSNATAKALMGDVSEWKEAS
jgi:hypothetical protein